MADKTRKWSLNVEGAFFVDETCIDCDLCRVTSPDCFAANEEGGHSYVQKQPETPEELELSIEALNACPVEAIGQQDEDSEPKETPEIESTSAEATDREPS